MYRKSYEKIRICRREGKRNKEHFEWLVRFQIQGWTIKEIADYYSEEEKVLGEDTIKKHYIAHQILFGLH